MNVGGYFRTVGNFTSVSVPKSGHFMPHDNYPASKAMLDDFIGKHALQCHDSTNGCSVVQEMCIAMNNCSGNGVCQPNGMCLCKPLFKGADCSYQAMTFNRQDHFT